MHLLCVWCVRVRPWWGAGTYILAMLELGEGKHEDYIYFSTWGFVTIFFVV